VAPEALLLPPNVGVGNTPEDSLLRETVAEVMALDLRPPEAVFDRGFTAKATLTTMAGLGSLVIIAGSSQNGGSRRSRKRLASHRGGMDMRGPHRPSQAGVRWCTFPAER